MPDIHHAAAAGFARGAGTYAEGRPDYPDAAAGWLTGDLGLGSGRTALDLGAGTGKFTGRLHATGAEVIAVEPVAAMRERLTHDHPDVRALEGAADAIPLANASLDAVICAQSFHWFATAAAMAEIRRVLKPGGVLGLIWNVRDESVAWVGALNAIMAPYEGDTPRYHSGGWRRVFPAAGFGPLSERIFPHHHTGPAERVIVERVLSVSFIAALEPADRDRVAAQVRALIADTPELAGRERVVFPYVTHAFHGRKTG